MEPRCSRRHRAEGFPQAQVVSLMAKLSSAAWPMHHSSGQGIDNTGWIHSSSPTCGLWWVSRCCQLSAPPPGDRKQQQHYQEGLIPERPILPPLGGRSIWAAGRAEAGGCLVRAGSRAPGCRSSPSPGTPLPVGLE